VSIVILNYQTKTENDMITLRNVLFINAVSSGATGLGLALMPGVFADLFQTSFRAPFVGTGLFLVAYAAVVFIESRRKDLNANWIRFIILMDALWVACSLGIIVSNVLTISVLGYVMIGAVALWVGLMGYLQYTGLQKTVIAQ
jgi:hypothetical protein